MKQYLLSVYHAEDFRPSPEAMEKIFRDVAAFNEELVAAGAWVFAGGLQPASTATVLRLDGDDVITVPGPFAGVREPIGRCWIIKAPHDKAGLERGPKATARTPSLAKSARSRRKPKTDPGLAGRPVRAGRALRPQVMLPSARPMLVRARRVAGDRRVRAGGASVSIWGAAMSTVAMCHPGGKPHRVARWNHPRFPAE
jgi:hypothetical protein